MEILNDGKLLTAEIQKVLHTDDFSIKEGAVILLKIAGEQEFNLKSGRKYITCVYKGWDPEIEQIYCISPPAIQSDLFWLGYSWHSNEFFKEAVMEITDKNYLENGAGQMWSDLIEMYRNSLHTATVFSTNDLETILIFHKDNALVTSGRTISREDYQLGNRVCLVSSNMAKLNGLELGDCVSLTFSEPSVTAIRNSIMSAESINHRNILEEVCFEIIGLYQVAGKMNGPYGLFEDTIFIPQKSMDYWPDAYVTMDNFVSFRLTNGKVEAFLEEMEEHELPGLSFTFYDQGYSKVVGALTSMKKTALLLTGVCALVGLGIVLLFSLLFVGRQQRSIAIMYSLGTSRSKALGFLLITVLIVVFLGAGIGGVAGYSLSDRVLADVFARNTEKEAVSAAYSEVYGEDTEADFQAIAPDKPLAPLAATGTVLLATLLFSGLFAARVLRAEPIQVLTQKEE
ncbi:MAG: hypothetical protein PHT52_07465 [Eubacteriales bacterium]|nr:hypothetical protein [Eubacteriales bacterium]